MSMLPVLQGLLFKQLAPSNRSWQNTIYKKRSQRTSQPVNSPLFKLFKSNFLSWGYFVEVEAVGIIMFLVCWSCKLFFLMVDWRSSFRVHARSVVLRHGDGDTGYGSSGLWL